MPASAARFLAPADVQACLPDPERQLALAERSLRALTGGAQLPAKIGVHPRPEASWAHAMPAWVPGERGDATDDLLGIKWVSGFPANAELGVRALHATLLLLDAATGERRGILDAGGLTAVRTAAVSGVSIRRWAPRVEGRATRVGILGAGVQAVSHLAVLAWLLPGCEVRVHDRDGERAAGLARTVADQGASVQVTPVGSAVEALDGVDVALTLVSFGPARQGIDATLFEPIPLVIAVDYDMCVPAVIAQRREFLVDEAGQFLANRASGIFQDYPDPTAVLGDRLDEPVLARPLLVTHLGTGVADLVFGDAVLEEAERRGLGIVLDG